MLFTKNFYSKSCFLNSFFLQNRAIKKIFFFKIMLYKNARKTQILRILRGKLNENVIDCMQIFFKIVLFKNNFFFKIVLFKIFFFKNVLSKKLFGFKIWRVVKILIHNLKRCKIFNSKSDAL